MSLICAKLLKIYYNDQIIPYLFYREINHPPLLRYVKYMKK